MPRLDAHPCAGASSDFLSKRIAIFCIPINTWLVSLKFFEFEFYPPSSVGIFFGSSRIIGKGPHLCCVELTHLPHSSRCLLRCRNGQPCRPVSAARNKKARRAAGLTDLRLRRRWIGSRHQVQLRRWAFRVLLRSVVMDFFIAAGSLRCSGNGLKAELIECHLARFEPHADAPRLHPS